MSHDPPAPRRQGGFTLIELLVVMAIIATLASIGMVGIPAIMRQRNKTVAQDRLSSIYKMLYIYHTQNQRWPQGEAGSGAKFPLAILTSNILDQSPKECEIFFDPSTERVPEPDLSNVDEFGIDWTGPDMDSGRMTYSPSMRNAAERVIVCNKVPQVVDDADLDLMPHAAKGIVYLTAGGQTGFQESSSWAEGHPVVGPNSSLDKFKDMKVYDFR